MLRIPALRCKAAPVPRWLPEEEQALRLAYGKLPTAEIARLLERSENCVGQRAAKLGLDSGRYWTPAEDALLRERYPNELTADIARDMGRSEKALFSRAKIMGLEKGPLAQARQRELAQRRALTDSRVIASRFKKGQVSHNKGKKMPAGWAPGRMATTQFKRGERSRTAELMHKPIGYERITRDGDLERKVNDDLPFKKRFRSVRLIVWETANGPLPPGHVVRFRDGMHTTVAAEITLDKLELIARAENMRRNSYHTNYPKEVGLAIQARGQLTRAINRATRGVRHV